MDQVKVANLLKSLRNEKNLTQEALAEKFSVSRRTVSRWETGANLPDIDILIEMSDFYDVDLREILDGERKETNMNEEVKETAMKVAEYGKSCEKRITRTVMVFLIVGIIGIVTHLVLEFIDVPESLGSGFLDGISLGVGLGALILALLYVTGAMTRAAEAKRRMLGMNK
ncbi:MAG: helix-turn-helix transcriptional regulator [Lachnospiraceae bacterium]|nr:helix-turn-helix transcriptional regulator [Lachnospiraceae bacterium]